ncbi:MAG TPA: Uma2 family endonuclease [Roseiflexaceae bacterium]|nr:Uma2 family endonuclease [Roseiflexaceae bacterium]
MVATVDRSHLRIVNGQDETVLDLGMLQGMWTEAQYLAMTDHSRRLLEFSDGAIEVLPMPTRKHQAISRLLFLALTLFVQPLGGTVFYAPLRLQIRKGVFREPDLLLLVDARDPRNQNAFWLGADLVVEIVSPDDPERDTVTKRADYAKAGIPEYWIVHPEEQTITVLTLAGDTYAEHGVFARGQQASSRLLAGFGVEVTAVLEAE